MDEIKNVEENEVKENIVDFPTEQVEETINNEVEKDDVYRLEEMTGEMEQSIYNVGKVLDNQRQLVEYVAKAEGDVFANLVNELNISNSNLAEQLDTMNIRHDLLVEVVDTCRNDEKVKDIVNKLLAALGVFRQ